MDFLVDILTATHYEGGFQRPAGCPTATPELQSRKQSSSQAFSCQYDSLPRVEEDTRCDCGDAIAGSDDPLDTVAAVAIAQNGQPPAQRYFDTEYCQIILRLRENAGTWETIGSFDKDRLADELSQATNRPGIAKERVTRLYQLLDSVAECKYTEGITLRGFSGIQYSRLVEVLADFPGVSRSDGWWLMLVAFDKPVSVDHISTSPASREELASALSMRA